MKKNSIPKPFSFFLALSFFFFPLCASSTNVLPAFPGAEGYGADTPGGRGGRVIEVTNLNDEGPGSLREALMAEGPRIVIFRVGGTIELQSPIWLGREQSYLTLAGQSAPGDGVQVKGWDITLTSGIHDVVIRYMRLRPGETGAEDWSKDGLSLYGETQENTIRNIIIDHTSFYWGPDEATDGWNYIENITWQWNLMEDIAHDTGVRFEESKAMLVGGEDDHAERVKNISIHHNFMANNAQRSPAVSGDGPYQIINNLVYNWRDFGTELNYDGSGTGTRVNLIGNYYKRGPESNDARYAVGIGGSVKNPPGLIFVKDNIGPFRESEQMDEWAIMGKGYVFRNDYSDYWEVEADPVLKREMSWPQPSIPITVYSARDVPKTVLENAGALLPVRDPLDQRLAGDFLNGTGSVKLASKQKDDWWPRLTSADTPADSDHDGMPDTWESANKFQLSLADGDEDADSDGYTNVEEYLNQTNPRGESQNKEPGAEKLFVSESDGNKPDRLTFWQRIADLFRKFLRISP